MKAKVLTTREISQLTGFTRTYINFLRKGKKVPSAEAAKKLEDVTGIPRLAWLYPHEFKNPLLRRTESATG